MAGKTVNVIACVYLPFYQHGNKEKTGLFIESIYSLQSIIDNYSMFTPVHLMGNFNVQLPRSLDLNANCDGFPHHNSILYNLLQAYVYITAYFMSRQVWTT